MGRSGGRADRARMRKEREGKKGMRRSRRRASALRKGKSAARWRFMTIFPPKVTSLLRGLSWSGSVSVSRNALGMLLNEDALRCKFDWRKDNHGPDG